VIVDANADRARRFYEQRSFLPFPDLPMKLFHPVADVGSSSNEHRRKTQGMGSQHVRLLRRSRTRGRPLYRRTLPSRPTRVSATFDRVRRLGARLVTATMERRPEIGFGPYDRFFPAQDFLPIGGVGNLTALPLQNRARAGGASVFIDGKPSALR
jgi:hypothetical protein